MKHFIPYQPGQPSRHQRIRDEEWEKYRTILTAWHYEGMPREEMLAILDKKYGFRPSKSQLLVRFNKWGLWCYDKAESSSRRAVVNHVDLTRISRPNSNNVSFTVKRLRTEMPTQWAAASLVQSNVNGRIRSDLNKPGNYGRSRHVRDRRLSRSPPFQAMRQRHMMIPTGSAGITEPYRPFLPMSVPHMSDGGGSYVAENVLKYVNNFVDLFEQSQCRAETQSQQNAQVLTTRVMENHRTNQRVQVLVDKLSDAIDFALVGVKSQTIRTLQEIGPMVQAAFNRPSIFLLVNLLDVAAWREWEMHSEYRTIVFNYLTSCLAEVLGTTHPLYLILQLFHTWRGFPMECRVVWEFLINLLNQDGRFQSDDVGDYDSAYWAAHSFIRWLFLKKDYDSARKWSRCHIQQTFQRCGPSSLHIHRAKLQHAKINRAMGNTTEALSDLMVLRGECLREGTTSELKALVLDAIARVHSKLGDHVQAAFYFRESLEVYLEQGGPEAAYTTYVFQKLHEYLCKTGQEAQARAIEVEYPTTWQVLQEG